MAPATWQALQQAAAAPGLLTGTVQDAAQRARVNTLAQAAYEIELTTPRTYLESARLFRIGAGEIATHRDGISITGLMPRLMAAVGVFDRYEVPRRGSSNFERIAERWSAFATGSGYFWLASQGNGRAAQVASGRAYVRAQLQATLDGVHMHPLSQALQEFDEVRPQFEAMHRLLGLDPAQQTLQMLARVGHGLVEPRKARRGGRWRVCCRPEPPAGPARPARQAPDAAPAVHFHAHAGDHRGFVAAQEARGVAQVLGRREAPDRNRRQELRAHLGRVFAHEALQQRRLAGHRVQRHDTDAVRRQFHRIRARGGDDPALAGVVPAQARPRADAGGAGDVQHHAAHAAGAGRCCPSCAARSRASRSRSPSC